MWLRHTATVDWCEENYLMTNLVAEFYNTISSITMALTGLLLYRLYANEYLKPSIRICHALLVFVGLGSIFFHATLSYAGQLADELTMLWHIVAVMCDMFDGHSFTSIAVKLILIMGSGLYTYVMIDLGNEPNKQFLVFQGTFATCLIYVIWRLWKGASTNKIARVQFYHGVMSFGFAWSLWLIDYLLCDLVQHLHLHALWHVFASIAIYYLSQLQIFVHMQRNDDGEIDIKKSVTYYNHRWQRKRNVEKFSA